MSQSPSPKKLKRIEIADYLSTKRSSSNNLSSSSCSQPSTSHAKPTSPAKQSYLSKPSSPANSDIEHEFEVGLSNKNTIEEVSADNEAFDIVIEGEDKNEDQEAMPDLSKEVEKKTKAKANYVEETRCKTYDEAKAYVESLNFGRTDGKVVKGGRNHFWRCKAAVKRGATKCPKTMKIFESDTNGEAIIYASDASHNHTAISDKDKSKKMSPNMQNFIVSQRKKNMTAKNIIKSIDEMKAQHSMFEGEATPNAKQIYYVAERQATAETPRIISVGDLVQWCKNNASIPIDEDTAYVIGYEHSNEDETRFFRFAVSTQRLLKHSVNAKTLCVDGTYKLNWQGYPFLIVGTVDRSKKFHVLAYACVTNETALDYAFLFQTLIDAVKLIHNKELNPEVLIADGDRAIRNACAMTFPSVELMIMCYVHVLRNVNKRPLSNAKNHRKLIQADIDILHLAGSEEKFDNLTALFIKKWKKLEPDFIRYFEEQWLGDLKYWFVGASVYDPSDNNHVEGKYISITFFVSILYHTNFLKNHSI